MNDLSKLARIIIIGLGIYILLESGLALFAILPHLVMSPSDVFGATGGFLVLFYPLPRIALGSLIIYLVVSREEFFVRKIVGNQESQKTDVWWLPFSFRLTVVLAGIFYIYWAIQQIVSTIRLYFVTSRQIPVYSGVFSLLGQIILLAGGIYLLCGAPHFVRWQVRKTIEQCKRIEEIWEEAGT